MLADYLEKIKIEIHLRERIKDWEKKNELAFEKLCGIEIQAEPIRVLETSIFPSLGDVSTSKDYEQNLNLS